MYLYPMCAMYVFHLSHSMSEIPFVCAISKCDMMMVINSTPSPLVHTAPHAEKYVSLCVCLNQFTAR